jgi:hypothetical protein
MSGSAKTKSTEWSDFDHGVNGPDIAAANMRRGFQEKHGLNHIVAFGAASSSKPLSTVPPPDDRPHCKGVELYDGAKCHVVTMSSKMNTGSYDALVNNGIAKLGSEETWRHMVSVVFRHSDSHTYRLVIKKLLFGERCLNCVMNNKSRGFCFFKVVDKDDRLNSTTEESLYKWVANEYYARDGCSATATDEPISLANAGNALTIFPEPEVLKVTRGNKRIPESHTLPSVSELFLTDDANFLSFLEMSMFESLCCDKQTINICFQAASSTWTEPSEAFRTRVTVFKQLEHLPWEKGRMLLKPVVDLQWEQWRIRIVIKEAGNAKSVAALTAS